MRHAPNPRRKRPHRAAHALRQCARMRLKRLGNVIDRALPIFLEDAVAQKILEYIHFRLIGGVVDEEQAACQIIGLDLLQESELAELVFEQ